jgi:hypothetical protein
MSSRRFGYCISTFRGAYLETRFLLLKILEGSQNDTLFRTSIGCFGYKCSNFRWAYLETRFTPLKILEGSQNDTLFRTSPGCFGYRYSNFRRAYLEIRFTFRVLEGTPMATLLPIFFSWGRDGGTNFILRIKKQETRLILHKHDDDDDDDDVNSNTSLNQFLISAYETRTC